jgi:hypothetical protein
MSVALPSCRIVLEGHGIVGALLDVLHPGLEHELDEEVALRKRIGDAQLDRVGGLRPHAGADENCKAQACLAERHRKFLPAGLLLLATSCA